MLVASNTTGNFANVRISKPVSQVVLKGTVPIGSASGPAEALKNVIVTVRHIDANTSHTMELVPQMSVYDLMSMTMVRMGYGILGLKKVAGGTAYADYALPIFISSNGGAVALNNDRYLTVTVENGQGSDATIANKFEIYGLEAQKVSTTRVNKFTRQFIPVGEKQRDFVITTQKAIYMSPDYFVKTAGDLTGTSEEKGVLSEVMLTCSDNSTPIYTPFELATIAREQNELISCEADAVDVAIEGTAGAAFNYATTVYRGARGTVLIPCVDGDGKQSVFRCLVKTDGSAAYEFYTLDWYDVATGGYISNVQ